VINEINKGKRILYTHKHTHTWTQLLAYLEILPNWFLFHLSFSTLYFQEDTLTKELNRSGFMQQLTEIYFQPLCD